MLDIKLIRDSPDVVRENLRRRGMPEKVEEVDRLIGLDVEWRKLLQEMEALRRRRNEITQEIAKARGRKEDTASLLKQAEQIPDQIKRSEFEANLKRESTEKILLNLPNIVDDSVPFGKDDNDNVEIKHWGQKPNFTFKPLDHIDIGIKQGLIDMETAARVAGARFYYLRGDLVRLNHALIKYGLDFIKKKGYEIYQPPYFLRKDIVAGAVALSDFEDVIYKIEGEDLYLLATSEHALLALQADGIIPADKLPLKYAAVSPCFRKEAGAHGRDTKGIFRVHQFEKVEQFIFSRPDDSKKLHEELLANAEEFFQSLRIPYRVVNVCTGDLGTVASKKYDIEAWLPGQGKYREVVSCSNCTSYQSIRSRVRFREKTNEPTKYPHTLNSTLVATERAMVAILENNQKEDGTVSVPKALQPYLGGQLTIPAGD